MEIRKVFYIPLLFFLLSTILFLFLFYNCITSYSLFDVDYEDLQYSELTFSKYETSSGSKSGYRVEIFFKEHDIPFKISDVTQRKLDKKALAELKENDILSVYYRKSSSNNYEFDICEIKHDSTVILSLSDYVDVNRNNQIVGMVLCPIMILIGIFLVWLFARIIKISKNDFKNLKTGDLGTLKIEYTIGPNTIQVYNSPSTCSLVINGKVVDAFIGLVAPNFCLSGNLDFNGKIITVEAKIGHVNMFLYCDGKLVCKKFMALG